MVVTERKPEYLDDKLLRNVDIRIVPNRVRNYVAYVKSMDKISRKQLDMILYGRICILLQTFQVLERSKI